MVCKDKKYDVQHTDSVRKGVKIHTIGFRKICQQCGGRKVRDATRCQRCRMLDPDSYDNKNRWKCDKDISCRK